MRLNLTTTKTTQGGRAPIQSNTHRTTTNNTIFKIVTQGLYIRPIEAIVREICTNALDGHIAANKPEVPFEVTLPTRLNPYFIVRDFGSSMNNDTVFDVYAVLGESTKNSSSNSIGGWGVGGKSPAAYTDTFFITAYLDGERRIYQSSYLSDRSPLELVLQGASSQKQGIEVKIPIREKDFQTFHDAVASQIAAFTIKPILINQKDDFEYLYDLDTVEPLKLPVKLDVPNSNGELETITMITNIFPNIAPRGDISIRMGCVLYPLNSSAQDYHLIHKKLETIDELSGDDKFIVDLPVDSVDIKPSREDLDYTDRTNEALHSIANSLEKHYRKECVGAQFKVRHMQPADAINYLEKNYSAGIFEYICKNMYIKDPHSTATFTGKTLKSKIGKLPTSFTQALKNKLIAANEETDRNYIGNLTVCDGEKTKKFGKVGGSFVMTSDMEITVFRKVTGFIKKLAYWLDNNPNTSSGLGNTGCWTYDWYFRGFKGRNTYSDYLILDEEQEDDYLPILRNFYKVVNIVDLTPIPADKVDNYRDSYISKYTPEIGMYTIYTSDFKNDSTIVRDLKQLTFSFKSIDALKSQFELTNPQKNIIYLTLDKEERLQSELLKELSNYFNKTFVIFQVPSSFHLRLIQKQGMNISSINYLIEALLSKVKEKDKQEWQKITDKNIERTSISRAFFHLPEFTTKCLDVPEIKRHFFAFVPRELSTTPVSHPLICNHFVNKDRKVYKHLAKALKDRLKNRSDFLLRRKPTLQLVDYYTKPSVLLELFSLNFKGFTYDNTKTSSDPS